MPRQGLLRAVLLDLFDTVAHSPWTDLRRQMAELLGVSPRRLLAGYERTQAERNVGALGGPAADLAEVLRTAGLRVDAARVGELVRFEQEFLRRESTLYDDVRPFVADVRRSGLAVGLVSNCSANARAVVDRLGLADLFDDVVLSFEVGVRKPGPAIYRVALERIRAAPEAALFLDDQPRFCAGAASVGMRSLLLARRPEGPGSGSPAGHAVVHGLDWPGLADLVRTLPSASETAASTTLPRAWAPPSGGDLHSSR